MNHDFYRGSDSTEAQANIKVLSEKLMHVSKIANEWEINIKTEVDPKSLDLKITVFKGNNQGFIKTITAQEIQYFSVDTNTLIEMLCTEIFEKLLKHQVVQVIGGPVTKSIINVNKMAAFK